MIKRIINKILSLVDYQIIKKDNYKTNIADAIRLQNTYTDYKELKLHFGCGARVLKDWINIDLSFEPYENYLKYYTETHYPVSIRGNEADFFCH